MHFFRIMVFAAAFLASGFAVGWLAKAFVDRDACLDAGGRWETRGNYCYGARPVEG
ncbi:hypothetical protein HGI47_00300 [Novosphingobium sp. ERN07]|uniref:hypothetical protein n=1 Tax=Novosphingobium sp. ERN07 TaxID=2726187 RepID=UPI0017B0D328|nr:hypothetical protein [Novosphingobium sp. ERN07]NLR69313.1 hypothetical protein [Novosphingobium sp. ERN07]